MARRVAYTSSMVQEDFRFGISASVQGADLNKLLLAHPASNYFMRVATDMPEFGLLAEDILIIDRAASPKAQDLLVAIDEDDPQLKIIRHKKGSPFEIWGVVVHLIRRVRT